VCWGSMAASRRTGWTGPNPSNVLGAMRLPQFIAQNSESILEEVEEFARAHTAAGVAMDVAGTILRPSWGRSLATWARLPMGDGSGWIPRKSAEQLSSFDCTDTMGPDGTRAHSRVSRRAATADPREAGCMLRLQRRGPRRISVGPFVRPSAATAAGGLRQGARSRYGFTGTPSHQLMAGWPRRISKWRCGVSAGALPVVPT
jgi:hypothetical protein